MRGAAAPVPAPPERRPAARVERRPGDHRLQHEPLVGHPVQGLVEGEPDAAVRRSSPRDHEGVAALQRGLVVHLDARDDQVVPARDSSPKRRPMAQQQLVARMLEECR
jgi:hypothetical protein